MPGARFVSVTTAQYARAPEFKYLISWVRREAGAVFGAVQKVPANEPLRDPSDEPVLVLDGRTLLTRRSLRRMAEVLSASGRPVAPVPLERTPLVAVRPVYTLRDFRQFRLLAQETELPERWRHPPDGMQGLVVADQSLRTKGFYVIAETD